MSMGATIDSIGFAGTITGIAALFLFQSLVAVGMGARFGRRRISFPRRIFPWRAFPALWRRTIKLDSIYSADAQSERTVKLYLKLSADPVYVRFSHRDQKQKFLNQMKGLQPKSA